jgi:ribosome-associated protein
MINTPSCVARLNELIARAQVVPKTRRPSRPTLGSKVRRLTAKSQRSSSKKLRGRTNDD